MEYYPPNQSYPSGAPNYVPPPSNIGGPARSFYQHDETYSADQYYMGEQADLNMYPQPDVQVPNDYPHSQRMFAPHFKAPSVMYSSNRQEFASPKRFSHPGNFSNRGNFQQNRQRPYFSPKSSRPRSEISVPKKFTCEICNISCSTKPSLDTHFNGQKHKKKAAQQATMDELVDELETPGVKTNFRSDFFCPVCEVTCTGIDTYKAHISGRLHLRALRSQKRNSASTVSPPEAINREEPDNADEPPPKKICLSPENGAVAKTIESFDMDDCIEEVKSGKTPAFRCRICDCSFTDPNSRGLHINGKKHQQLVKRSQNPTEYMSTQNVPKNRSSKISECSFLMPYSFGTLSSPFRSPLPHLYSNERYMQTKIRSIAPSEEETLLLKTLVLSCETALKKIVTPPKPESVETEEAISTPVKETVPAPKQPLSGVLRVGGLASSLIIAGDNKIELVLVCDKWPTTEYTIHVGSELESLVKADCPQYKVSLTSQPEDGTLFLHAVFEDDAKPADERLPLSVLIRIQLTSVEVLKEPVTSLAGKLELEPEKSTIDGQDENKHLGEALPCNGVSKNHCIDALTDVRRALWLQSALYNHSIPSYIINVGRIFRSLMRDSHPGPHCLPDFALLILLERLSYLDFLPMQYARGPSAISKMRPGIIFRRLLEMLAAGTILPGSQLFSLEDPSVKNSEALFPEAKLLPSADLFVEMSTEQREMTTFTAQLCLRLMIFRQIFKVLNIPQFIPRYQKNAEDRKRKIDSISETPADVADTAANEDAQLANGAQIVE